MATDLSTELASFHEFIGQQLQSGAESLSPEQALSLWRERADTIAALYEGLQAVEEGRTKPLDQFEREFAERDAPRRRRTEGMVYDDFLSLMEAVILPGLRSHPDHIRLDGAPTGGNRDVAGRFHHHGKDWVVHADTHYEPLLIAYKAAANGVDPFAVEPTRRGACLSLKEDPRRLQKARHKHLYIYSWDQ